MEEVQVAASMVVELSFCSHELELRMACGKVAPGPAKGSCAKDRRNYEGVEGQIEDSLDRGRGVSVRRTIEKSEEEEEHEEATHGGGSRRVSFLIQGCMPVPRGSSREERDWGHHGDRIQSCKCLGLKGVFMTFLT